MEGMDTGGDDVVRRRDERDVAVRRLRIGLGGVVGLLVAAVLLPLVGPATGAVADPVPDDPPLQVDPAPTGSPTGPVYSDPVPAPTSPAPTAGPSSPAVAPTIADPGDITTALGRFSGTATPGHVVRVVAPASPSGAVCRSTTDAAGRWSCVGRLRSGPAQVFRVVDTTDRALPAAAARPADVVVPPVVTTDRPTTGAVDGVGEPGATVTVARSASDAVRTALVGADGTWHVTWRSGPGAPADGPVSLTATQTASTARGYRSELRSAGSPPVTVTVDRTAPAAPRITTPAARATVSADGLRVAGTAEAGSTVTVYLDRVAVCRATVGDDGRWSCRVDDRLTSGAHRVLAGTTDAAGNTSRTSGAVSVSVDGSVTPGSTTASPAGVAPSGGRTGTSRPGPSRPGHTTTTAPGAAAAPGDGGSAAGGTGPAGVGGRPDRVDAADWGVATAYDSAVPTLQTAASWHTVGLAGVVAAVFLVLAAGPLALLAGVLRDRLPRLPSGFTGRNRPRSGRSRGEDTLPAWVSVSVGIGLAGLLTLLGTGVALEARYLRLALGVLAGTAVLSAGVVCATRWAAGTDRRAVTVRLSPWLVLAAVVGSGLTRAADLSPALLVGVLLVPAARTDLGTGVLRLGSEAATSARTATWRSVTLLVLAVACWVLHSVVPSGGFGGSLVAEFASTLCIGGLGALVVTLVPVAGSAGAALAAADRVRWAVVSATAVALATAVAVGDAARPVPLPAVLTVAVCCVLVAAASWTWHRTARRDARA